MEDQQPMSGVTYFEAIVVGLLQGVTELFPISSLGHSVLLPALLGGQWARDLTMSKGSPYLSIIVAMHVATALALVVFFWRDWVRLLGGLVSSIRNRRIDTPEERLIWLLIAGTVPVGIAGLILTTFLEEYLGKPVPSALFLVLNGIVLYAAERLRRRGDTAPQHAREPHLAEQTIDFSAEQTMLLPTVTAELAADRRLSRLSFREGITLGAAQIAGLLPGLSRSGSTIAAGLFRGLRHDDAARFAFLLATPIILAAGVLKLPQLFTPQNHAVLGPALLGSLIAGIASYISVRFLTSYFETRTLTPFAVYCMAAGLGSFVYFVA
jgi:undecaprenyl-diphosphatase